MWTKCCVYGFLINLLALSVLSFGVPAKGVPANFVRDKLVAWCVVPFDAAKRGPEERAAMLKRLGITRLAYDWRAEHVPTFEREILALRKEGIEFFAFWGVHEDMFKLFEKYGIHPQIWQTLQGPEGGSREEKVEATARKLLPLVKRAKELGCKLGLYNHGGWGGEPASLVAVCKWLRAHADADHVGIVYNLHHGHGHIEDFGAALAAMKPYLLCLNLNGMNTDAKPMVLPVGAGQHDRQMLRTILESGYAGPIGILDHRPDVDAEKSLRENLTGLEKLLAECASKPSTGASGAGHAVVVVGSGRQTVTVLDAQGQTVWEYPAPGPANDVHVLPNGNILFAYKLGAMEVTPDKKIAWQHKAPAGTEIHTAQPLPGGNVLICQNDTPPKLITIDPSTDKVVKTLPLSTTVGKVHGQFRVVRQTAKQTYLVPHLSESKVCEYDMSGKLLWEYGEDGSRGRFQPFEAELQPNGNVLIACGDGHRLVEVNREKKIVWEVKQDDLPAPAGLWFAAGIHRLENGNTIACSWDGHHGDGKYPSIMEITPEKTVVWSLFGAKQYHRISNMALVPDVAVFAGQ